ncbi:MAG: hypothetical protein U0V73_10915 [Acidimicrobiia bacterium]
MKLKSRGLGRKELTMDFREYVVRREGKELVIQGTIREPVHWDFSIRMCEDDLAGVTRVALQRPTIGLLVRAMFKRNKDAHWSVDRKTQIEQAKTARKEQLEKVAEEAAKAKESARSAGKRGDDGGDGGGAEVTELSPREQRRLAREARQAAAEGASGDGDASVVEMATADVEGARSTA